MKDFDHLVYYLILYMYALTNFSTGKNYTVFDHGILVNNAATAENGILNGSLHLTAVGNESCESGRSYNSESDRNHWYGYKLAIPDRKVSVQP